MQISEYCGTGMKSHAMYDFVDVNIDKDNRLFIDPTLIDLGTDEWSKEARSCVDSFFDALFNALKVDSDHDLFAHAHEQNATKLGYGNGNNGKGKTADGLNECLGNLKLLVRHIPTISKCEDVSVLVKGFAEDFMSDLITNIIHKQLNEFTTAQMGKFGVEPTDTHTFWTWCKDKACWEKVTMPCWTYIGREILLVPKWIVRKNFLFKAHQYLMVVIIERLRREAGKEDLPKLDIWNSMKRSSEHWEYDAVVSYTKEHPDALSEYHRCIPSYYNRKNAQLSDEDLDELIYGEKQIVKSE